MMGIGRRVESVWLWFVIVIAWAALIAWDARHFIGPEGPDSISYLDMASETLRHGVHNLINGYWSPLYPAVLAAALAVLRPSPVMEFPLMHFVAWLMFVLTAFTFLFFFRAWLEWQEIPEERRRFIVPFGFGGFFWPAMYLMDVTIMRQDMF
ncbi:MAG: hypothetical protein JO091_11090, partial [Acidobacteriaceae bacterium]|nr:hypothetical protein [Acidobacteriaceae bacterium]